MSGFSLPRLHPYSLVLAVLLVSLPACEPPPEQLAARAAIAEMDLEFERTAFLNRIHRGDVEAVELFLKAGMSPNVRTDDGKTALVVAYERVAPEIVTLLVEAGARLHNDHGVTRLHIAAQLGDLEEVEQLLQRGADPDGAIETNPITPLFSAAREGHRAVVDALLEAGATVDARSENGATPLMPATARNHAEVVRVLLEAGADANVQVDGGSTPLNAPARMGWVEVIELLLEAGAEVDARPYAIAAAGSGNPEAVRLLLEAGADPNIAVGQGGTAIMLAAYEGHAEVAQVLLEGGADPNVVPQRGGTALETALERGYDDVAAVLRNGGAER